MKRRFWQKGAILPALLWMILGCSAGGPEMPDSRVDPGPAMPELLFLYPSVISQTEFHLEFSVNVRMLSIASSPDVELVFREDKSTIKVNFQEQVVASKIHTIDFIAEDAFGQTVSSSIKLVYSSRINQLMIFNQSINKDMEEWLIGEWENDILDVPIEIKDI